MKKDTTKKRIELFLLVLCLFFCISLLTKLMLEMFKKESEMVVATQKEVLLASIEDRVEKNEEKTVEDQLEGWAVDRKEIVERISPFHGCHKETEIKFNYDNETNDEREKLTKELESKFKLIGITKNRMNSVAMVSEEDKVYLLKRGEWLDDFKVRSIQDDNITLIKDNFLLDLHLVEEQNSL